MGACWDSVSIRVLSINVNVLPFTPSIIEHHAASQDDSPLNIICWSSKARISSLSALS